MMGYYLYYIVKFVPILISGVKKYIKNLLPNIKYNSGTKYTIKYSLN